MQGGTVSGVIGVPTGGVAPQVRSFGKSSLVMPISTFSASPAKMSSDLFWAFQPKRVIVPSFPLVLKVAPSTPKVLPAVKFWLF